MKFSKLETEILDWIVRKESDESLVRQIKSAIPLKRKYTPVGLWLSVEIPKDIEKFRDSDIGDVDPVVGPAIRMLKGVSAESAIYVTDGYFDTLEVFTVEGEKLDGLHDFELFPD